MSYKNEEFWSGDESKLLFLLERRGKIYFRGPGVETYFN